MLNTRSRSRQKADHDIAGHSRATPDDTRKTVLSISIGAAIPLTVDHRRKSIETFTRKDKNMNFRANTRKTMKAYKPNLPVPT